MIKIEKTEICGWQPAIRGARNPMNSWDKSDSIFWNDGSVEIGKNDLDLMTRLAKAGADHRKFMRMIVVYADITAPLYWWKEYDTYKVGTVANSCSTMHKIHEEEFGWNNFSYEHLKKPALDLLQQTINLLNKYRLYFIECELKNVKDKKDYWWQMIQLLPSSYNQKRTVELNYEVLRNMYHNRKDHKLTEWHTFCDWILRMPYAKELIITN